MNQIQTVALLTLLSTLLITVSYWLIGGWTCIDGGWFSWCDHSGRLV
ncbi:hypothetical protein [Trichocoleus sp. FACHB-69]|nr:hypothetical protein [Trichocoleus sp. FACHB-69]